MKFNGFVKELLFVETKGGSQTEVRIELEEASDVLALNVGQEVEVVTVGEDDAEGESDDA